MITASVLKGLNQSFWIKFLDYFKLILNKIQAFQDVVPPVLLALNINSLVFTDNGFPHNHFCSVFPKQ